MGSATPTLAYILKGFPRISETFISNEILLLEKLGFSMRLFPMRKGRESFCHDSVKQIKASVDYLPTELLLDFRRLIIPNIFLAVKQPERYLHALREATRRYQRTGRIATFKHLFQGGYLTQTHLSKDPSICQLHGHFAHSPTSVTMFASLLSGLPFSFTAHAKDIYTSHPDQLREKLARALFVTTCTRHNAEFLKKLSPDDSRIHCNYHGIDIRLFNNSSYRFTARPPYSLLTVARIIKKKGLPTVYHALRKLADRGIDFTHELIGDGDDRDEILALISELKLENRCRWLGTLAHDKVLQQFRRSDCFVLGCEIAEDGDRDGIPNVIVESLAMGVPVVSTNVSAIPEILIGGKTGLTVDQKNPAALADAMQQILTDSELRKQVIENGKSFVAEHFDNHKLIIDLARVFINTNPALGQNVDLRNPCPL